MYRLAAVFLLVLAIICVLAGLYTGIWICLIGGIVNAVNLIKSPNPVDGMDVAITAVRIIFFQVPIIVGFVMAAIIGSGTGNVTFARRRRY